VNFANISRVAYVHTFAKS